MIFQKIFPSNVSIGFFREDFFVIFWEIGSFEGSFATEKPGSGDASTISSHALISFCATLATRVLRVSERRKCAKKDKRCRGSERGGRPHVASLTSSTSSSESLRYSGSASVPTTRRAPRRSLLPRPLSAPPIAVRLQWRKKKAPNERERPLFLHEKLIFYGTKHCCFWVNELAVN